MTAAFALETFHGSATEFHATDLLAPGRRRVVTAAVADPAIVLGSRQDVDLLDADACRDAGVSIVRRRSGGGLVLVEPHAMVWFDVVVPAGDPRFAPVAGDVGASMRWLGAQLGSSLAELGLPDATVHGSGMTGGRLAELLCFAGLGPGELLLGGRKLVGISQRRTRHGSRFQCMVHLRWDPRRLIALLAEPRPDPADLPDVAVLSRDVAEALPAAAAAALSRMS